MNIVTNDSISNSVGATLDMSDRATQCYLGAAVIGGAVVVTAVGVTTIAAPAVTLVPIAGAAALAITGNFYICFIMNIALHFRPVNIRLYVAYMADAFNNFPSCTPGNTVTRIYESFDKPQIHPYLGMWGEIIRWYDDHKLYELSDAEIIDMFNNARANGLTHRSHKCSGMDIMRAKQRWEQRGWMRYERKRNGRRSLAYKMLPVTVLGMMGITMPVDV
jgi:transposase